MAEKKNDLSWEGLGGGKEDAWSLSLTVGEWRTLLQQRHLRE